MSGAVCTPSYHGTWWAAGSPCCHCCSGRAGWHSWQRCPTRHLASHTPRWRTCSPGAGAVPWSFAPLPVSSHIAHFVQLPQGSCTSSCLVLAQGKPHWRTGKKKLCQSGKGGKRPSSEIFQIHQLPSKLHQNLALCQAVCPLAALQEMTEFAFTLALAAGTSYKCDCLAFPCSSLLTCVHTHETHGRAMLPVARVKPGQGKAPGRHASAHPSTHTETQGMPSGVELTHRRGGVWFKACKHTVGEEGRAFPIHPEC